MQSRVPQEVLMFVVQYVQYGTVRMCVCALSVVGMVSGKN